MRHTKHVLTNSRARSTKTRIETAAGKTGQIALKAIREQDPLKQGLKLSCPITNKLVTFIREQDPLKQGLKPFDTSQPIESAKIREQDPLKQGLKL